MTGRTLSLSQPYNQYIEPYLDLLIEEEEKKRTAFASYQDKGEKSLIKMKQEHQRTVQALLEAMNQSKANTTNTTATPTKHQSVSIKDVSKYCDQLVALKHTGKQFRQMMETNILSKQREFQYMEKLGLDLP